MKIGMVFFLVSLIDSHSWASCVDTFGDSYNGLKAMCASYNMPYCDQYGDNTKSSFSSSVKYSPLGGYYLDVECRVKNCRGQDLGDAGIDLPLCGGDHQVPETPPQALTCPKRVSGSIIFAEDQVVGESIPVVGSEIKLNYFSSWVKGRGEDYRVDIPFTGPSPSGDLPSGSISISLNGSSVYNSGTLSGTVPNQSYSYIHVPSASAQGSQSYSAGNNYWHPIPGISVGLIMKFPLGGWRANPMGPLGWVPSSYAFYDINANKIYFGDGSVRYEDLESFSSSSPTTEPYVMYTESGDMVYYFDIDGKLKYIKSGRLGTTLETYVYVTEGLSEIQYPFGKKIVFNRNSSGDLTSITAPNGQITTVTLNSDHYIASITNPNSETYSFTYHSTDGLLETFTKPNGEVSTFGYNSVGRLIQDFHSGGFYQNLARTFHKGNQSEIQLSTPMSRTSQFAVNGDKDNYISLMTKPNGTQTTTAVQRDGINYFQREELVGMTKYESSASDPRFDGFSSFNSSGDVYGVLGTQSWNRILNVSLTDDEDPYSVASWVEDYQVDGVTFFQKSYNPTLKKYTTTTNLGKTAELTTDIYERTVSTKAGNLTTVSYNYTNEKLTSIVQGARTTSLSYNSLSRIQSITNALSQTTGFVYDLAGRIISIVYPDSRTILFGYNSNGVLNSITPSSRPAHAFIINSSELMSAYSPPVLSGVSTVNTTYLYNNDKQLTKVTRPDAAQIDFVYDPTTGFMNEYSTPEGVFTLLPDIGTGKVSQVTRPDGRLTNITYGDGQIIGTQNLSSTYVNLGKYDSTWTSRRISSDIVTGTSSSSINYLYNNDHELRKAGDVNITYHVPNGYISGTTMGSGATAFSDSYAYNPFGEVTGYTAKRGAVTVFSYTLTRDSLGRVDSKTQTMNSVTDNFIYTFDVSGRLTRTDKNSATVATYNYDSNSNRNGGTIGLQPTTATYDNQDRMLTFNTFAYTYNANGELTSKTNSTTSQITTYTYDVLGNLRQVNVPPSTVISYDIDGLNRRIAKKVNGIVQKRWIYMDQHRIAAELNAAGAITKRFVYGSKGNIPDYVIASGQKYRIFSDHLGSPRLVVKQSDGSIMQRMNHDEFGRVIEDTNPGYVPFGFAGGLYDHQTGLVRFGARDYDPEVGRWTSKDPILFNGQMTNLYGYSFNDPVNFIDSDGKNPALVAIPIAALVGGVASSVTTAIVTKSLDGFGKNFASGAIGGATAAVGVGAGIVGSVASIPIGLGASLFYNLDMFEPNANDFFNGLTQFSKKSNSTCSPGGN